MAEASFTDILQDRTHKYRRTLIAVCLIIMAAYWLPIRFDDLQLFGIKPKEGYPHTQFVIFAVLWGVWLYHVLLFAYYAQRDWKDWRSNLRLHDVDSHKRQAFPEIGMYFPWAGPSRAVKERYSRKRDIEWEYSEKEGAAWSFRPPGSNPKSIAIPGDNARSVRSRVGWFFAIDLGFPFILSIVALVALAMHL